MGDSLSAALASNIVPDQEYLLQGSILDTHVEALNQRLKGLCDNVFEGHTQETFAEREMVFVIGGVPVPSAGPTPSTSSSLSLRVRRPLDPSLFPECPWQLRYVGQPQSQATVVRTCFDIACSENVVEFLTELGCRLDYEFVAKGLIFRKGHMKITVSKLSKILIHPGSGTESLNDLSQSNLVELSVLAPSGTTGIAEEMKAFAEQLRPLVMLDKIDGRRGMAN